MPPRPGNVAAEGLTTALNADGRYVYKSPEDVVDFIVIGGGVVGLSIAQRLAASFPTKSTYLIERHARAGEETSSRNSEVIHAGIYYPPNSLKTRLCLRGKHLLYQRCASHNIPFKRTGKLVIAQPDQLPYIRALHEKSQSLPWPGPKPEDDGDSHPAPTTLISGDEVRAMEPDLAPSIAGALWSPSTGIVDSHTLMESLEKDIAESPHANAALAYNTRVVRVDPAPAPDAGWAVQTVTTSLTNTDPEPTTVLARTLINASGLAGPLVLNALLPAEKRFPMFFARGSYASYRGPGVGRVQRLLYPCPPKASTDTGSGGGHAFQSLGTHLTLDLHGNVRFGPDLEWLSPEDGDGPDFWARHLVPDPDGARLAEMRTAVAEYLPGVALEGLAPDYAGVRPKLTGPGGGFNDFVMRTDYAGQFGGAGGRGKGGQMITLLGIESPGLTASLAIAEMVVGEMLDSTDGSE